MYRYIYIFLCLICHHLYTQTEIVKIPKNSIDFHTLLRVHAVESGCQSRWIYKDPAAHVYYKIWNKDYSLAPDFLNAVEAGFFKETTILLALIFDENYCCGYIIPEGNSIYHLPIILEKYSRNYSRFAPINTQTHIPFIDFYDRLLATSKETGYAFIDLTPTNIIEINNELLLIDLESVRKISSLGEDFFYSQHLPFDYKETILMIK